MQKKIAKASCSPPKAALPPAKGALVGLHKGKLCVVDGPFSETKEIIGGFALFELKSKQEAIAEAHEFLEIAGDGEVEVRLIHEQPGHID